MTAARRAVERPARRRWLRWVAGATALILLGYVVLGSWSALALQRHTGWLSNQPAGNRDRTVLLIGTDARPGQPGRADTLLLIHLPANEPTAYLISVPRELNATLPEGQVQLRTSRQFGGVPQTVRAVQQVTGLRLDHVVEANFEGFAALAGLVGGVRLPLDQPLRLDDGRLLGPGETVLDGPAALAYVRDHTVPDDVRNLRQRAVLTVVLAKLPIALLNPVTLARLPNEVMAHFAADDAILAALPDLFGRLLASRDRVVPLQVPLLPRRNGWDPARLDPARMAVLTDAIRVGTLTSYRPDQP